MINAILRKNLGDAQVVTFIFRHGIPKLVDVSLHQKDVLNTARLHKMLEEFMTWHASLLQHLVERKQLPEMHIQYRLSDLNQKQWQMERRQNKVEAKKRLQQGVFLAMQRDYKKRRLNQMCSEEQQTLKEFDTKTLQKQYEQACVKKPQYDWSSIWFGASLLHGMASDYSLSDT